MHVMCTSIFFKHIARDSLWPISLISPALHRVYFFFTIFCASQFLMDLPSGYATFEAVSNVKKALQRRRGRRGLENGVDNTTGENPETTSYKVIEPSDPHRSHSLLEISRIASHHPPSPLALENSLIESRVAGHSGAAEGRRVFRKHIVTKFVLQGELCDIICHGRSRRMKEPKIEIKKKKGVQISSERIGGWKCYFFSHSLLF